MKYRFIGSGEADLGDAKLSKFGEPVTLSDKRAAEMILGAGREQAWAGAVAILPEDRFARLGITEVEMEQYAYPGYRVHAPTEFRDKLKSAFIELEAYRTELESPSAAVPEAPKPSDQNGGKK